MNKIQQRAQRQARHAEYVHLYTGMLILALVALMLTFTAAASHGAGPRTRQEPQPYGGCAEAWQAPQSSGADDCRADGWLVGKRYVVNPADVLRYYNLPTCVNEDGSGQANNCGYNVESHDCGYVFLVLGRGEARHVQYLNIRVKGELVRHRNPC